MKLNYDVLCLVARYMPDRSRLHLCMADRILYEMTSNARIRDHMYKAFNPLRLGFGGPDVPPALDFVIEKDNVFLLEKFPSYTNIDYIGLDEGVASHFWVALVQHCASHYAYQCLQFLIARAPLLALEEAQRDFAACVHSVVYEDDIRMFDILCGGVPMEGQQFVEFFLDTWGCIAMTPIMLQRIVDLVKKHLDAQRVRPILVDIFSTNCASSTYYSSLPMIDVLIKAGTPVTDPEVLAKGLERACSDLDAETIVHLLRLADPDWESIVSDVFNPWNSIMDQQIYGVNGRLMSAAKHPYPWKCQLTTAAPEPNHAIQGLEKYRFPSESRFCHFCTKHGLPSHRGSYAAWLDQIHIFGAKLLACVRGLLNHGASICVNRRSGSRPATLDSLVALAQHIVYESRQHFESNQDVGTNVPRLKEKAQEFRKFCEICFELWNAGARFSVSTADIMSSQ